jgi:RNA recognition motif-containing protein
VPDSAKRCLEATEIKINDKPVVVTAFIRKKDREDKRKNIYLKNLPNDITQTKLEDICKPFGTVSSYFLQLHKENNKPFAFVCFNNNEDAERAYEALKSTDPFGTGETLYVNWAEK